MKLQVEEAQLQLQVQPRLRFEDLSMFERLEAAWEGATQEWDSKIQTLFPNIQKLEPSLQAMDKGSKGQRKEEAEVRLSSISSAFHMNTIKSHLTVYIYYIRQTCIPPLTLLSLPLFPSPEPSNT
jgi:50S ribosomal subunit-associated GTPase HflX